MVKDIDEIKKLLKTDKIVIGTEKTLKNLKQGKLAKVFLSSNCSESAEKDLTYYVKLANAKVVKLDIPNDELGVLCKKQFSISVLGIVK